MDEILIPLIFFSSVVSIAYLIITTRHKEKMAMIEKNFTFIEPQKTSKTIWLLRLGPPIIGVGLGLLATFIFVVWSNTYSIYYDYHGGLSKDATLLAFSSIFVFAGMGFVIGHYLERKSIAKIQNSANEKQNESNVNVSTPKKNDESNELDLFDIENKD